jgi:hypothetical protein
MQARFDHAGHMYIALTPLFTVNGQFVLKGQIGNVGAMPGGTLGKLQCLLLQLLNRWIMAGLASAFLASLAWMAAMTRLDLNYANAFMSLTFLIVMAPVVVFLNQALSLQKILGSLLLVTGLVIMTR